MRYFSVEREVLYVKGVGRREVCIDGTPANIDYEVDNEENPVEITAGFVVWVYDENGLTEYTEFYPVITNTRDYTDNSDEVLAKIVSEHPASEWQNNNW